MGAWTKQPGEASLYALIRRDQFTAQRIDALATFASNRLGRNVQRAHVVKWLRKYAAFQGERDGTEYILFEMPEAQVNNLPDAFARQFGPRQELPDVANQRLDALNELLGTDEGEL